MAADPISLVYVLRSLNSYGGVETAAMNMLRLANRKRYTPSIITVQGRGMLADEMERDGIPVLDVPVAEYPRKAFWMMVDEFEKRNTQIVHCHLRPATTFGRMAALAAGVPVRIAHEHDNIGNNKKWRSCVIDCIVGHLSSPSITLTKESAAWEAKHTWQKLSRYRIIRNGIDPEKYAHLPPRDQARQQLNLPLDVKIAGYVGRLWGWKNVVQIIRAFNEPQLKDVHLIVAGNGEDRPACEKTAQELNITDRIHLLGNVPDLKPVLASIDAFAFASGPEEGQGLVLMEAMSAGVPVIATKVGLMLQPDVTGDEYVLVKSPTPPDIAAALAEALIPERGAELRQKGYELMKKFSIQKQVEETESFYVDCLRQKGVLPAWDD